MGKRKRFSSPFDIITEDGILCSIISLLPLREAVRTCVLSRRWKHIWTHLPNLNFDSPNILHPQILLNLHEKSPLSDDGKEKILTGQTDKFIRSVDSVLQQHHDARVEKFMVEFFLHKIHSRNLDSWVRFVVASKTKKFDLLLEEPCFSNNIEVTDPYDFPCQLLGSSAIEELSLTNCSLKMPCKFDGLNHLKVLDLCSINVTEEEVKCLLSNCSTLEELSMSYIDEVVTLSIPQSLSQLKYLNVDNFFMLEKIEIGAVNLSHLKYMGDLVDFTCQHSSQLKNANICFAIQVSECNLDFYLTKLSRSMPRLRSLTLSIVGVSKVSRLPKCMNSFIHLIYLDMVWHALSKMSLLCLSTLLDAAPVLEKFQLRIMERLIEPPPETLTELRKMLPKHPHTHLKTIEIEGFCCDKWQIEIALYLLTNATKLESMTIERCPKSLEEIHVSGWITNAAELESMKLKRCPESSEEIHASALKNLIQQVPTKVKFVILQCS